MGLKTLNKISNGVFGIFMVMIVICITILALPILLYRVLATKLIAPLFKPDILKPVDLSGQAFATEFRSSLKSPRCTIVTALVIEGKGNKERIQEVIKARWIDAKDEGTGKLNYPELQHYISQWMGFMFWKRDKNFDLKNHLYFYDLEETMTPSQSKKFGNKLMEELLNKPYHPQRSPWDLHFILNYRDPELLSKMQNETHMTLVLFRSHHAMNDGYAIFSLLVEGYVGVPLSEVSFPQPVKVHKQKSMKRSAKELCDKLMFPLEMLEYFGQTFSVAFRKRTPWHCSDEIKTGRQLRSMSPLIYIDKIKHIKNKFGCSFSSVILSSISAGVSHSFKSKNFKADWNEILFGIALPLPGHPKRLTNHATGTVFNLSTNASLDPLERLRITEKTVREASSSQVPKILPFLQRLASLQLAPITRFILRNRIICSGMSNFRGPAIPPKNNVGRCLSGHFVAGLLDGIGGVGFTILSFDDHIHIVAIAEAAVMSRDEVDELVGVIYGEIDKLYKLSLKEIDEYTTV